MECNETNAAAFVASGNVIVCTRYEHGSGGESRKWSATELDMDVSPPNALGIQCRRSQRRIFSRTGLSELCHSLAITQSSTNLTQTTDPSSARQPQQSSANGCCSNGRAKIASTSFLAIPFAMRSKFAFVTPRLGGNVASTPSATASNVGGNQEQTFLRHGLNLDGVSKSCQ